MAKLEGRCSGDVLEASLIDLASCRLEWRSRSDDAEHLLRLAAKVVQLKLNLADVWGTLAVPKFSFPVDSTSNIGTCMELTTPLAA